MTENSSSFPADAGWPMANQMSLSNKTGNYIGWDFSPPFRAMTLDKKLRSRSANKWDLDSVVELQSDISDERFVLVKDELVRIGKPLLKTASVCEKTFVGEIEKWNGLFETSSRGATLAIVWLRRVTRALARNWYGKQLEEAAEPFPQWRVVQAVRGPREARIWSISGGKADKDEFIRRVLRDICTSQIAKFAEIAEKNLWGKFNSPAFASLTGRIPSGTIGLETGGGVFSLFSQGIDHGTILRAVMKVKSPPEYYFSAPDGPDGDPESLLSSAWSKTWESRAVMKLPSYSGQEIEAHHGK